MTYDALRADGTVRDHGHTPEETAQRLREMEQVARRHLADAGATGLSSDAKHNLACAAGRVAAEMVMVAEGYRAGRKMGKDAAVFAFLGSAAEGKWSDEAAYFDKRRERRNVSEYEQAGTISPSEADTVLRESGRLLEDVLAWLGEAQPSPGGNADA
ncbi:MAG: hypothetical protein FJX74_04275 [Armatimonadetes bacterium]|nr:hypothetical protein [Armatimonadota bacterium]